ncbi:unnamed protein product [Miscanthus lutarioriparius]|uniref:Cysteine proteinase inhibitor n=1 Tax=Miscanthus lutarioriparius TaxID=422564 RepID=A0A811RWQ4_9POAL|nr:unnamed protein product [Miscanthus lutarioriparius]
MAETNGLWGWWMTSRNTPAGCEKGLEDIKLACFTDAEHNGKTNVILEFEMSVKVRHQVVARTMHHFTVEVKEASSGKKLYKAKAVPKHPESGTDGSVVAAMELVAGAVSPKLAAAKLVARADDWAWGRTVISSSSSVGSKFKSMFLREALALLIGLLQLHLRPHRNNSYKFNVDAI